MTSQNSYREKGRAMFLATIMVLSMVAVGATFAAPAAAQSGDLAGSSTYEVAEDGTVDVTITAEEGSSSLQVEGDVGGWTITSMSPFGPFTVPSSQQNSLPYESANGDVWNSGPLTSSGDTFELTLEPPADASAGNSYDFNIDHNTQDGADISTDSFSIDIASDNNNNNGNNNNAGSPDPAIDEGTFDDGAPDKIETDSSIQGTAFYQGQEIEVTVSGATQGDQVQLRNVQSFGTDGNTQLSQQLTADSGGVITVDTEDLSGGDYFLTGLSTLPTTGEILNRSNSEETFSINEQTLTAAFDVDSRTNDGVNSDDPDFEFDSNRGSYPVTIHANGDLDTDELIDIFVENDPRIELAYTREDDDGETDFDEIGIVGNAGAVTSESDLADNGISDADDFEVDFDSIDAGSYEFSFTATDSTAVATDSIEVTEANEEVNFVGGVDQSTAGDIAEFNFTLEDTDDTYLQFGDEDSDFVDVMYVEIDDEDEPVNIKVNTRLLGTDTDISNVYDTENTDTFQSEVHSSSGITALPDSEPVDTEANLPLYDNDGSSLGNNFEDYLDELDIINKDNDEGRYDQLIRPLQPTDYSVTAAGTTSVDDGVFDADPGGEANDELGSKVLELTQPEIGEITVHKAPEEDADDEDNVADLVEQATPSEDIAIDDQTIIQVEATGIYGTMIAAPQDADGSTLDSDFDRLEDGMSSNVLYNIDEELDTQITFEAIAEDTTGNQGALELALQGTDNGGSASDSDVFVVLDEENGQFFVVADTSSDEAFINGDAPDEETSFDVTMEYDADNEDDRFEFNDGGGNGPVDGPFSTADDSFKNYPYLQQGETISSSASFDLSPRSIVFDNLNDNQVVEVGASGSAEVSGTTNVAPGSDATLRVASTDASSSFRVGNDLNITEDGSVTTSFDLSDQEVGDQFDLVFQVAGSTADTSEGIIVESVGTEEPADGGEETNQTDEPADGGEDQPADDGETETNATGDDGGDGATDDGTPGFGAVVALIALIGAALLAVRRQN